MKLLLSLTIVFGANTAWGLTIHTAVNPANGHTYHLLADASWTDSEAEAVSLGGHLTTINDAAEHNWVFATFGSFGGVTRPLWIGLNDAASEGTFVWVSGESSAYTNWLPGRPDGAFATEDYVHMQPFVSSGTPGQWEDRRNDDGNVLYGVVEVVPEPGIITLIALSVLGLAVRRRAA